MNPIESAGSAHYENVFGVILIPTAGIALLVILLSLLTAFCGGVIASFALESSGKWKSFRAALGIVLALVGVLSFGGSALVGSQQNEVLFSHMNSNLNQKYGVKLADHGSGIPTFASDDVLAAPMKLSVVFPNGATAEYNIRFDRATSEPFVVTTPNLEPVNK